MTRRATYDTEGKAVILEKKPRGERRRKYSKAMWRNSLQLYVFLLPVAVGMVVCAFFPILLSLFFSFSNYNGAFITRMGTFNYESLFNFKTAVGRGFSHSMLKTFEYVLINLALTTVLSYMLALFLRREIRGVRVLRTLFYLPCIIPGFIGGFIFMEMFRYSVTGTDTTGIINGLFVALGLPQNTFFTDSSTAMATLIATGLFTLGGGTVMLLAAFSNIDPTLYEAAQIDGASYLWCVFSVTVPLSTPIVFYNLITSLIAGLQTFNTYAAYGTGPENEFNFMAVEIYVMAFRQSQYGLACAEAYFLFLIIGVLTLIIFKKSGWVQYAN